MKTLISFCLLAMLALTSCDLTQSIDPILPRTTTVTGELATISMAPGDCCVTVAFKGSDDFTSRWFVTLRNDATMVQSTCPDPANGAIYRAGTEESMCFNGPVDIEVTIMGENAVTEVLKFKGDCHPSN